MKEVHYYRLLFFALVGFVFCSIVAIIIFMSIGIAGSLSKTKLRSVVVLNSPVSISKVMSMGNQTEDFTDESLLGRWSLVYINGVHHVSSNQEVSHALEGAYQRLSYPALTNLPQVVLMSSEADKTLSIQQGFSEYRHDFIWLQLQESALNRLITIVDEQLSNYHVSRRQGCLLAINPNGDVVAIFKDPKSTKNIASNNEPLS